jgi:NAD+ diphosphatase
MSSGHQVTLSAAWRPRIWLTAWLGRRTARVARCDRIRAGLYPARLVSDFVPLVQPPDSPAVSGSLWFHVRGTRVHVAESPLAEIVDQHFLGMLGTVACWAADVPDYTPDPDPDVFQDLRSLWGHVPELQWTIAGRAVQIVEWGRTHRYCGRCGTATEPAPGERAMRCSACGLLSFPRLAPAVIVLITRDDQALLARGRAFPMPMYSCIAGFVEPGETLEEAVRREVREEVGVELADVRYEASQPWPFPHSLMIGFTATWASGDIVIDPTEILDAQWFTRDDPPMIPPSISIARRLIDTWLLR